MLHEYKCSSYIFVVFIENNGFYDIYEALLIAKFKDIISFIGNHEDNVNYREFENI